MGEFDDDCGPFTGFETTDSSGVTYVALFNGWSTAPIEQYSYVKYVDRTCAVIHVAKDNNG